MYDYDHTLFRYLHILVSDSRPHIILAVRMVIASGHFIFLIDLCVVKFIVSLCLVLKLLFDYQHNIVSYKIKTYTSDVLNLCKPNPDKSHAHLKIVFHGCILSHLKIHHYTCD